MFFVQCNFIEATFNSHVVKFTFKHFHIQLYWLPFANTCLSNINFVFLLLGHLPCGLERRKDTKNKLLAEYSYTKNCVCYQFFFSCENDLVVKVILLTCMLEFRYWPKHFCNIFSKQCKHSTIVIFRGFIFIIQTRWIIISVLICLFVKMLQ